MLSNLIRVAVAILMTTSVSVAQTIPRIETADLNGKTLVWPSELPRGKTLLIVGFSGDQQSNIDGWVEGLGLKSNTAISWYEVPLIDNPGALGRWFISNGMRRGIQDLTDRAHVVTVYTDKGELMKTLGLKDEGQIHLLVVDGTGKIFERVSGDFTAKAGAIIIRAMAQ
jgi:hypothetical protein